MRRVVGARHLRRASPGPFFGNSLSYTGKDIWGSHSAVNNSTGLLHWPDGKRGSGSLNSPPFSPLALPSSVVPAFTSALMLAVHQESDVCCHRFFTGSLFYISLSAIQLLPTPLTHSVFWLPVRAVHGRRWSSQCPQYIQSIKLECWAALFLQKAPGSLDSYQMSIGSFWTKDVQKCLTWCPNIVEVKNYHCRWALRSAPQLVSAARPVGDEGYITHGVNIVEIN